MKCICAFLVVQIHTLSPLRTFILPICKLAVPIFFLITGYFLTDSKGNIDIKRLNRGIVKVLKITGIAQFVYLSYYLLSSSLVAHQNILDLILRWDLWINVFFIGDVFGIHLWYLTAYILAALLLLALIKIRLFVIIPWFALTGITMGILLGKYAPLFMDKDLGYAINRNFLTMAFPMFVIGLLIRRHEHYLRKFKYWPISTLVCIFILYAEYAFISRIPSFSNHSGDMIIMTIPAAICLFMFFIISKKFNFKSAYYIGRNLSLNVYIYHIIILDLLIRFVFPHIGFYSSLLVFSYAVLLAYIIDLIKNCKYLTNNHKKNDT